MEEVENWRLCTLRRDDAVLLFRDDAVEGDLIGPVVDWKWNPNARGRMGIVSKSGMWRASSPV